MDGDIGKALTYQVKREIAEKYFGWRSAIYEDIAGLERAVREAREYYDSAVGKDLVRIYSLLGSEDIIASFLNRCGWDGRPFYDEYVVNSPTIRIRLLEDMERHGWTDSGRFKNLVLDAYRRLYRTVGRYREKRSAVEEELSVIKEELRLFKEKFSLDEIMGFLRSLDQGAAEESLAMTPLALGSERLEERLEFPTVDHLEGGLPDIPELPPPGRFERELKELANHAFVFHRAARSELPLRSQ